MQYYERYDTRMGQYFPEPYVKSGWNINIELDLSNYLTKTNLKKATSIDTYMLESETDFASLKTKADDTYVDELDDLHCSC